MAHNRLEDRRTYKRVNISEPVRFQLKDPKLFGSCLSCDVSEGGVRMKFNDFVPLGEEIHIDLHLTPEKVVECTGKVVWVKKLPYVDHYEVGLEFSGSGSTIYSKHKINKFIMTK